MQMWIIGLRISQMEMSDCDIDADGNYESFQLKYGCSAGVDVYTDVCVCVCVCVLFTMSCMNTRWTRDRQPLLTPKELKTHRDGSMGFAK